MAINSIDATDLRNNLGEAMKLVSSGQRLIIKKRGRPQAALIDLDELEDLLEASDPDFVKSIKESRAQYKKGEVFSFDEVFGNI